MARSQTAAILTPCNKKRNPARIKIEDINIMSRPIARADKCLMFRLSVPGRSIPLAFLNALDTLSEALLVVGHYDQSGRDHVHAAVWNIHGSRDNYRKRFKALIAEHITTVPLAKHELSIKRWDGSTLYVVYMLKGGRGTEIHYNSYVYSPEELMEYRGLWISNNKHETNLHAWQKSDYYPKPLVMSDTDVEAYMASHNFKRPPTYPFNTIIRKALEFANHSVGSTIPTPDSKYIAKNLISAFCYLNQIKVEPYYI